MHCHTPLKGNILRGEIPGLICILLGPVHLNVEAIFLTETGKELHTLERIVPADDYIEKILCSIDGTLLVSTALRDQIIAHSL